MVEIFMELQMTDKKEKRMIVRMISGNISQI